MILVNSVFGTTKKGEEIRNYVMTNKKGMALTVSNYGALLVSLAVPDKKGKCADVVLGLKTLEEYYKNSCFLGATVGRHANRIGGAKFTINGTTYELEKNDNKINNLHSGKKGYQNRVWKVTDTRVDDESASVTMTLHSPDLDQGYPGNVDISLTYTLKEDGSVMIGYFAVPDQDTIINLTNHSYFNLAGHDSGDVLDQIVWIDSDYVTETDKKSIPNGNLVAVANTPMDFNTPKTIGQDIEQNYYMLKDAGGYDHNYVLKNPGGIHKVAFMFDPKSGRKMEVYTDLPGMQFYTGNYVGKNKVTGKSGSVYVKRAGACFETQYFPDAVNHENFVSPVIRKGNAYTSTTIYKFSTEK